MNLAAIFSNQAGAEDIRSEAVSALKALRYPARKHASHGLRDCADNCRRIGVFWGIGVDFCTWRPSAGTAALSSKQEVCQHCRRQVMLAVKHIGDSI